MRLVGVRIELQHLAIGVDRGRHLDRAPARAARQPHQQLDRLRASSLGELELPLQVVGELAALLARQVQPIERRERLDVGAVVLRALPCRRAIASSTLPSISSQRWPCGSGSARALGRVGDQLGLLAVDVSSSSGQRSLRVYSRSSASSADEIVGLDVLRAPEVLDRLLGLLRASRRTRRPRSAAARASSAGGELGLALSMRRLVQRDQRLPSCRGSWPGPPARSRAVVDDGSSREGARVGVERLLAVAHLRRRSSPMRSSRATRAVGRLLARPAGSVHLDEARAARRSARRSARGLTAATAAGDRRRRAACSAVARPRASGRASRIRGTSRRAPSASSRCCSRSCAERNFSSTIAAMSRRTASSSRSIVSASSFHVPSCCVDAIERAQRRQLVLGILLEDRLIELRSPWRGA